jgi:uncharacterized membrane protein YraQ (UPF0718 family)
MPDIFRLFADWLIFDIFNMLPEKHLTEALHFFVMDTFKIFTLIIIIMFIAGYIRASLTEERIKKAVSGKSRFIAYPIAVALGAITPFCSCSSIPLFIGFLQAGIPLDITMAFLITSPMVNEVGFAIIGSTISWEIATVYAVTGLSIGIIGGLVIKALKMEKYVEPIAPKTSCCCCCKGKKLEKPSNVQFAINEVKDILKKIWIYIVIGIGFGAAIHGYIPEELMAKYASADNIFAVPIAVLAGIPVYANHTGVIPIIEALLNKGVPVGTSLAFMMSISAISLPEIIILRKVLKPQMIIAFTLTLFFCFIAIGYMFNYIYG